MRVLIDEDTAVQLLEPLAHVRHKHRVDHVTKIGWAAKKDRSVLADAKTAGYHVIITKDRAQLDDPDECDAIKRSGLHHVRYRQRHQGVVGLGLALGSIIAAMPMVMNELEETTHQMLVRITAVDPTRRYVLADPRTAPPSSYWPR